METVFQEEWMTARIDAAIAILGGVDEDMAEHARGLRERIVQRVAFVKKGVGEFG